MSIEHLAKTRILKTPPKCAILENVTEISIRAEEIFRIGHWPITNALLLAVVSLVVLTLVALFIRGGLAAVPGKIQSVFEIFLEEALQLMDTLLGSRHLSEKYLPLVATIFLFVLTSNWLGLLPGIGSIGIHTIPGGEHGAREAFIPLFRAPAADLNFTIILALVSVLATNILGVAAIGFGRHFSKFFTVANPILSFAGILEFIAEFVKIVSFSFRLFGNVFAGEVLLIIIVFLVPYIIPLPFLFLEIFVGFVQAVIFAMLTLVFIASAVKEDAAHH